jgi:hypothetical protein
VYNQKNGRQNGALKLVSGPKGERPPASDRGGKVRGGHLGDLSNEVNSKAAFDGGGRSLRR